MIGKTAAAFCASAILLSLPVSGRAADPTVLEPASPWNVDYANDRCRLLRLFGPEGSRTALLIEQLEPSEDFDFTVAGPPFRQFRERTDVRLQFGPNLAAFDRKFQAGSFGEYDSAMSFGTINADLSNRLQTKLDGLGVTPDQTADVAATNKELAQAQGAQIDWIELRQATQRVKLRTGSLEGVFAALNTCTENLLQSWGVDSADFASVATDAVLKNGEDVARRIQRDYPRAALAQGRMANFRLRLFIDPVGNVTDCRMLELSDGEGFDDTPCRIMLKHARFDPALDDQGNAVADYDMVTLRYILP